MPTSATGRPDATAGFTLVELLVVLAIVSLLTGVVVLAVPRGPTLADEAATLAIHLRRAHEQAILTGRPAAVALTPNGYTIAALRGGGWTPLAQPTDWRPGTTADLPPEPRILFDPTGLATPARLVLQRDGEAAGVTVDEAGEVRIDAAE